MFLNHAVIFLFDRFEYMGKAQTKHWLVYRGGFLTWFRRLFHSPSSLFSIKTAHPPPDIQDGNRYSFSGWEDPKIRHIPPHPFCSFHTLQFSMIVIYYQKGPIMFKIILEFFGFLEKKDSSFFNFALSAGPEMKF